MKGYERENEEYRLERLHEACFKDLTGKKFNKLTVLGVDHIRGKSYYWKCKCDCGNETVVYGGALVNGHTKSCGCAHKKAQLLDLTGNVYGRLTVVGYDHQEGSKHFWKCNCACGKEGIIVDGKNLRSGSKKSCGCLKIERCKSKKPKEDLTGRVFGDLTVESYVKHSYWKCKCKCGGERVVHSLLLNNGEVACCLDCRDNHISNDEKELRSYVSSIISYDIVCSDRDILDGKEIDIYIPELKIGIEYNGSSYHASEGAIYDNKPKNYHQNKFLKAKQKGVHLISVFDIDWYNDRDIVKSTIKSVLQGDCVHTSPSSNIVYTNNDFDDGEWLKDYGYSYDGQEDIPYFIYLNKFKVYRSGISRWKK